MEMSADLKAFLGRGWKFPVALSVTGKLLTSEHEQDVREAIWIIISTSKGERVMQPTFGCGIHDFVFATLSVATLGLIESSVREALIEWEPRIEINEIRVEPDPKEPSKLYVDIHYRVRTTNNEFNLVYPFYLRGG
jgi:phage baseplate assembly protein W